jgi:hypothetical protein
MKRSILLSAAITMVLFCVMACNWIFDPIPEEYPNYFSFAPNVAKPGGNTVSLLEGNIELIIPEGAIDSEITLKAKVCDHPDQCKFLLKMVKIEPNITFMKPVTIKFKYDGILSNSNESIPESKPVICYWKNEEDYLNGVKQTCISCCNDTLCVAVKFCMQQTGIFAVGNNGNGEFN